MKINTNTLRVAPGGIDSWFIGPLKAANFKRKQGGGFSLIEVVLAIGVVSFAFLSIFGLVPMGMTTFRASIDSSIGTRISQQVVNEVQETDFNTLVTGTASVTGTNLRYFDVDGQELKSTGGAPQGAIYQVNTRILPVNAQTPAFTLPGSDTKNPNQNLTSVTVQIANNPGNQPLQSGATGLWSTQPGVSMTTYSTVIAGYYSATGGT